MEDIVVPAILFGTLFIGLPWILFHYITQWKKTGTMSLEDERLLDDLHDLARRLDERMRNVERIVAADDPGFRRGLPHESLADYEIARSVERDGESRRAR